MGITKATRFQIIKPLDASWEEFGKVLQDLSYQTTKMCNAAIQLYWENHHRRLACKAETGKYPGKEDEQRLFGCSFRNHVYRQLRELYPLMASSNTSQTNQFAMKRWRNDVKDIMYLRKSIPYFRLGTPVQVANQNYALQVAEGEKPEFRVDVTLLSREAERGRFSLLLDAGDASKKAIFRRIMDGTYKQGAVQIVRNARKRKWFCVVAYTFEANGENSLDENRIMGVNFAAGTYAIYWAFNFSPKRGTIPVGEVEAVERKVAAITARRKELQRTSGMMGHGRKRKLKPTEALVGKSGNIRDAVNHKYSKRLVQIAAANRCGIIRLADMSGVKLEGAFGTWPWADLVQKIQYKAEEAGITVQVADRKKAGYTCSKCGYCHPENVEGNIEFLTCKSPGCGGRIDMDYNTARNIACDAGAK